MKSAVSFIRRLFGVASLQQTINLILREVELSNSSIDSLLKNKIHKESDLEIDCIPQDRDAVRAMVANTYIKGDGIEVGAFNSPLALPSGVKALYVDKYRRHELPATFSIAGLQLMDFGAEIESIVDPDVVDDGENLSKIGDLTQDFVVANHVLEHFEDPIKGFKNMLRVLKHGGILYLSLPEMRRSFDRVRQETSLIHILDDYRLGPQVSRHQAYSEFADLFVQNGIDKGLFPKSDGDERVSFVNSVADELMKKNHSIHFHAWTSRGMIDMFNSIREVVQIPYEIKFLITNIDEVIFIFEKKEGICSS